jgi:tungstate transport system substrate-binding protein
MPKILPTSPAPGKAPRTEAVLAVTTSLKDSGFADAIKSAFQESYPQYGLNIVAGQPSELLALGKAGHAAVLLVDVPAKGAALVSSGEASQSTPVMQGVFVLVGPAGDPASVRTAVSAVTAFKAIAAKKATFVSASGAEALSVAEAAVWTSAGVAPRGKSWYLSSPSGSDALTTAASKGGYTLVENTTWLAAKPGLPGSVAFLQGDKALVDRYVAVLMKGAANPAEAQVLEAWLAGPAAQMAIGGFGVKQLGQSVYSMPTAP